MKLVTTIKNFFTRSNTSGTSTPSQWLVDWISGGSESASGVRVTETSALKFTPFWAAVRVISGTLASLPFQVYKRQPDGGKIKVQNHPTYQLLHNRPNEYMDAVTFLETRMAHVLTYGNAYAEIQRDGAGRPIALWPLLPDKTNRKVSDSGVPYYEVTVGTEAIVLLDYNVLHIKGLGFDGYTGYNVVDYSRDAIGYGVAVKEYGARFFGQDANPGGVLEHPGQLTDKALEHLQKSWAGRHSGLSNKHRMQILEEGTKWNPIGVDPGKAQALEVQKYNVDDCSRIFNIPPHKLGSMDRATFSNIEEQNIDFITSTMSYWFRKWESECNYKLFMPSEQKSLFCEVLMDAMLRGNTKDRYAAYAVSRQWGWLSVNDIREKENMNRIGPEGDIYLEPLNMHPAGEEVDESMSSPSSTGSDDDGEDDLRKAIRGMIEAQFKRCIPKSNAGKLKMDWAESILIDSIRAYAATSSVVTENRVRAALVESLTDMTSSGKQLKETDAHLFSDRVIKLLGGPNGKAKN